MKTKWFLFLTTALLLVGCQSTNTNQPIYTLSTDIEETSETATETPIHTSTPETAVELQPWEKDPFFLFHSQALGTTRVYGEHTVVIQWNIESDLATETTLYQLLEAYSLNAETGNLIVVTPLNRDGYQALMEGTEWEVYTNSYITASVEPGSPRPFEIDHIITHTLVGDNPWWAFLTTMSEIPQNSGKFFLGELAEVDTNCFNTLGNDFMNEEDVELGSLQSPGQYMLIQHDAQIPVILYVSTVEEWRAPFDGNLVSFEKYKDICMMIVFAQTYLVEDEYDIHTSIPIIWGDWD